MDYLEIAKKCALKSGEIIKKYFYSEIKATKKKDMSLLTLADLESEKIIIKEIKKHFPNHSILGEETGYIKGNEYTWIIDPMDGTTNFYRKIPYFSISIALVKKDKSILGVVYNPISKIMFYGENEAYVNENKIKNNFIKKQLNEIYITYGHSKNKVNDIKKLFLIRDKVKDIRKLGSTALELCYVAWKKTDVYLGFNMKEWDIKAGLHIAKLSGCKIKKINDILIVYNPKIEENIEQICDLYDI